MNFTEKKGLDPEHLTLKVLNTLIRYFIVKI